MFRLQRRLLFAALLVLSTAAGARADLVDTFNSENGGVGQVNYNNFANFFVANTAQGGSVDLIGNGLFDFYPGNGLYVDLGGSTNGPGGLLTTKQTFAAGSYKVSFDLAGSARGVDRHVAVNFGGFSQTFLLPSAQGYTLFTEIINLAAPAQLSFQNIEPGNIGAILDNVSVISIPEPHSLAFAGVGALVAAGYAWRRKRRA
jgi:hypothetical protein